MVFATYVQLNAPRCFIELDRNHCQGDDVVKAVCPAGCDPTCYGAFFNGKRIAGTTRLRDVPGLRDESRVFVMATSAPPSRDLRPPATHGEVDRARDAIHAIVDDPRALKKLLADLADHSLLDELRESVPGLDGDRWTLAILSDVEVLSSWFDESDNSRLTPYPVLIDATMQMCARIRAAMRNARAELHNANAIERQIAQAPSASIATTPQLAITREMLQAAMGQVMPSTVAPQANFDQQLRQLNEMGFVDVEENLTALRATGGDFEMALEFIISQRESMS